MVGASAPQTPEITFANDASARWGVGQPGAMPGCNWNGRQNGKQGLFLNPNSVGMCGMGEAVARKKSFGVV